MPLYFLILIASVSIPALYSIFVTDFIKDWKAFIFSTTAVAIIFLIWDAIFTANGYWGFNPNYSVGWYILKMPIEEWMFFFIIPFCSLFIHYAFYSVLPSVKLSRTWTIIVSVGLMILSIFLIVTNTEKAYTFVDFIFFFAVLLIGLLTNIRLLQQFYLTFLIILIPFMIVNGILTGVMTDEPVVWYNSSEFMGIRVITIPAEDFAYAFSMLFLNLLIFERIK